MDGKSFWVDKFELGSLSGDSQKYFSDLLHAGETSYLHSQLNTDDFMLVKRGSGVLRSCEVCLSNAGVKESHVGLVNGGQGRTGNRQLSMQRVVFQTFDTSTVLHCGFNTPRHDDRLRLPGVRERT